MSSTVTVRTNAELTKAVEEATQSVRIATMQAVEEAVDKTAKEAVKQTREKSPKRTGVYAKSWKSRKVSGSVGTYGREVYQGKKPSLTHLLENGHEIKGAARFRKNKDHVDAFPHIMQDDETEKLFEENLLSEIEKGLDKV